MTPAMVQPGPRPLRAVFLLVGALALGILVAVPAWAQSATEQQILFRLDQLQQELRAVQSQLYSGGTGGTVSLTGNAAADMQVRLDQLERDQQNLTGQIEELSFQVRQIGERLDRFAADVEYRLQALEGGGAAQRQGAAPATSATQSTGTEAGGAMSGDGQMVAGEEPQQLGTLSTAPSTETGGAQLPGSTAEESYQYAFGLMRQSKFDQAEVALKSFLAQYPSDPLAGNAQYWLGETYYARGDYAQAAVAFAEGYQEYPNSRKAPDNVLKLAKSLAQLGRTADACAALVELPRQMPNAPPQTLEKAKEERQRLACP
jgi:tol-pal system protein YbgF